MVGDLLQSERPTQALINLEALKQNSCKLKEASKKDSFFCPMVKADAYGHGAVEVCRALKEIGIKDVGVATFCEAVELRGESIDLNIYVFSALTDEAVKLCEQYRLSPVVARLEDLQCLSRMQAKLPQGVHLKLNTGMNRLDLDEKDFKQAIGFFNSHPEVPLTGVLSHLSTAEDIGSSNSVSLRQLQMFESYVESFAKFTDNFHMFNSLGLIAMKYSKSSDISPAHRAFGCRPGIAMYGAVKPEGTNDIQQGVEGLGLVPAMSLQTRIVHKHNLRAGEAVSYGGIWVAKRSSVIGVLPVGYADGLNRRIPSGFRVKIGEQQAPIIGRICMDFCMIDLTEVALKSQPEVVEIFGGATGGAATAVEMADELGTISYEVLTSVGKRVPRVYKGAQ